MNAGLYIHIPFCMSKCPYCDFYSKKYDEYEAKAYTRQIICEMSKYEGTFDTIYFGGGTPSVLDAKLIKLMIDSAKSHFDIKSDCEITVECNPSKDLTENFQIYAMAGVNRISLGMQSAVDKERFALGRRAGSKDVMKAVNDAKAAGIDNISLDLMLGTPKQTLDSLDTSFEFIKCADVKHVSAYMLKIEQNTKFYDMRDTLPLPTDDSVCDMYLKTIEELGKMGLSQYEISNFAKTGYESRHNVKYWRLAPYLGLGASAHSFWGGKRFYYDSKMDIMPDGDGGNDEEKIMLGLRLSQGIDKNLVKKDILPYIKMGLMYEKGNNIALTAQGMLVSNSIISELI